MRCLYYMFSGQQRSIALALYRLRDDSPLNSSSSLRCRLVFVCLALAAVHLINRLAGERARAQNSCDHPRPSTRFERLGGFVRLVWWRREIRADTPR